MGECSGCGEERGREVKGDLARAHSRGGWMGAVLRRVHCIDFLSIRLVPGRPTPLTTVRVAGERWRWRRTGPGVLLD